FSDSLLQFVVSSQSAVFRARRSVHRGSERPARANSPAAALRRFVHERDGVFEVPARNRSGFALALPVGWRSIRPIEPPLCLDAREASEVRMPEDMPAGIAPVAGYPQSPILPTPHLGGSPAPRRPGLAPS